MKKLSLILIILICTGLSISARAAIDAQLDHNQIAPGESVQLTLQHDGQTNTQPDLTPLKQDFDIAGQSSGTSMQIINGKMKSEVELTLMLVPKRSGTLQVPSITWDGQSSPALALNVSAASGGQVGDQANNNALPIFIRTELVQKQPYVQAAATLIVKLYVGEQMAQASMDFQPGNDVLIQQLGKDRQVTETYQGRNYQVIERKYLLFPQHSGLIHLAGPVLNAQVADRSKNNQFGNDPFFNNVFGSNPFAGIMTITRPIRIQADTILLDVRPRPAINTHDWLPAQDVTLQATWQPDSDTINTGEPVTLHLHLSATGLTAGQLPDLSQLLQLPAGLHAYPDQAKLNTDAQGDNVIGTRDQDVAIIANNPGKFDIPALHLYWWDTVNDEQKVLDLPAHVLDITGAAVSPSTNNNATPGTQSPVQAKTNLLDTSIPSRISFEPANNPWKWISFVFAFLWLATLIIWWRARRSSQTGLALVKRNGQPINKVVMPRADVSRNAFWQACQDNDKHQARHHLLEWAKAVWPQNPPVGIKSLSERLNDPVLSQLLNQLDRACYTEGEWKGAELRDALNVLRAEAVHFAKLNTDLPSLYPASH